MKYIKTGTLFLCAGIFLSSCLKQNDGLPKDINNDSKINLIELTKLDLTLGVYDVESPSAAAVNALPDEEDVTLGYVRYASASIPTTDKTVQIGFDTTGFADAGIEPLTSANSTWVTDSNAVVIKAGTRVTPIVIHVKKSILDLSLVYGIGIRVKNAGTGATINPEGAAFVAELIVKNSYDGAYSLRIKTTGWAAYNISDGVPGTYPLGAQLVTTGANTVTEFLPYTSGFLQPAFDATGTPTQFGAATPQFTFDLTTNKLINVVNLTPDSRNRAFAVDPDVTDSRYDPSTKTIYAAYIMNQNGRPTQHIYDTLVYTGPR